jgi:DNA-binding CsgD family transcriptional regulator
MPSRFARARSRREEDALRLTPREREVLGLVIEGHTNQEIAVRLGIQEQTVKAHVSILLDKFHARNRVSLAVAALRKGIFNDPLRS